MKPLQLLHGLVAAPHTPFRADGSLNLPAVERQAEHLLRHGVRLVFICGTTGEWASLTTAERLALVERWMAVSRGTELKVAVHVGANALEEARLLAAHAHQQGALCIAAVAPSFFKPGTVADLVEWCAAVAAAAPEMPFYYYDIPAFTGVQLSMPEFLEQAVERIPNFAGLKYTGGDLMAYQRCLRVADGALDVAWGRDEWLLAALALGAKGAVGSTYNLAAPLYHRLLRAFEQGDWETARLEQFRAVQLIELLARHGFLAATKAVLGMLGVDVGQVRLPLRALSEAQIQSLRRELEGLGFWDWLSRP
ncbi:MAG: dihydrodipicolinate synthase family protein [Verrucomicrobiae bacterium]|nr:dihydrodipicolinate synthase family protein [Verrucomicrobiae bacterium]